MKKLRICGDRNDAVFCAIRDFIKNEETKEILQKYFEVVGFDGYKLFTMESPNDIKL